MEAKEIGLSIDASQIDVETVRLCYLIKSKLREKEEKKPIPKQGGKRRGGR